jgi:prohibitin 1
MVSERGIDIEDVPLRNIILPPNLTKSIEEKLSAEQQSERMKFVLEKEKFEAERKSIEAKGISDFQKIVSEGISQPLLTWKGIEATQQLAQSQNSKIIIIGGKDGLPIILNTDTKN